VNSFASRWMSSSKGNSRVACRMGISDRALPEPSQAEAMHRAAALARSSISRRKASTIPKEPWFNQGDQS
jgi:hypothetical protein